MMHFSVVRNSHSLTRTWCSVIRDGRVCTIPAEQLVVGDLLFIRSGVHLLADVRLLYCNRLKCDTCCLITGETESIELTADVADSDDTALEARNIAFRGSFCIYGDGLGVVIRVAGDTLIDGLLSQTAEEDKRRVSLKDELMRPMRLIVLLAVMTGTLMFVWAAYMVNFENMLGILVNGFLVIIVASVPQGLPTALLCHLTIAVRRFARKNLLLKDIDAVQPLGATSVIVSDMVGTLTADSHKVARLWCDKQYFTGRPEVQQQELSVEKFESPLLELLAVMTVCNRANTVRKMSSLPQSDNFHVVCMPFTAVSQSDSRDAEIGDSCSRRTMASEWSPSTTSLRMRNVCGGDATESALLQYASDAIDANEMRARFDVVFEIPFDPVRRRRLIIARIPGKAPSIGLAMFTLMVKGHPHYLLDLCATLADHSGPQQLNEQRRLDLQNVCLQLGDDGHGVIGFASKTFAAEEGTRFSAEAGNYPQLEYRFLGMAAVAAESHEETIEAVQQCRNAGIKVFAVTSEDVATAEAIARRVGLISSEKSRVQHKEQQHAFVMDDDAMNCAIVDSASLSSLSTQKWDDLLRKHNVIFARATFEHKLLIVEECRQRGEVVTVVGANCGDVPALRRSDIGFAITTSECELAEQAADIIVADGKIGSILAGIEESRLMYDYMKKATAFTLSHLWPEIFALVINLVLGFPRGLTFPQILSIDLGSDLVPAITLAWEKSEGDLMRRPARKREVQMVNWKVLLYSYVLAGSIIAGGCFAAYISVFRYYGISTDDLAFSFTNSPHNASISGFVFSASDQQRITAEASSAWYITLAMSQVFHVWMCTTRRTSIFHRDMKNSAGLLASLVNLLLICFLVFTPGVQSVMGMSAPPFHVWFFSVVIAALLLMFNEARKCLIRLWPSNKFVRLLEW
uniref:Cation-transporting P-type ATPase C-terminal domain-containing protein n=1 Tax=Plectus sambesii TaxID=2011161 RepID=A0A914X676_9BILA